MKKYKDVVLGIVKNKNNKYLFTQRIDPDIIEAHLKWDIVGGTKKPSEEIENTIRRECIEETGYNIKIISLLNKNFIREWKHKDYNLEVKIFCFYCISLNKVATPSDNKISEIKWYNLLYAFRLDLLPTTREFLKYFYKTFPNY